jgi:hypothetical protein
MKFLNDLRRGEGADVLFEIDSRYFESQIFLLYSNKKEMKKKNVGVQSSRTECRPWNVSANVSALYSSFE